MIEEIMTKMIAAQNGSLHDINHLIKVWTYARTIGKLEKLDGETQLILETAAIVHDIACQSLRQRYGKSDHRLQEIEGEPMAEDLLSDSGLTCSQRQRVCYLVAHHHTPREVNGMDYQILLEADYIVNAGEWPDSPEKIQQTRNSLFKTASGIRLLNSIYQL